MKVITRTRTIFDKLFNNKPIEEPVPEDDLTEETKTTEIPNPDVKPYEIRERRALFLYESNELTEIAERLLLLFEREKPFLNPRLTLSDLSVRLTTTRNYLSKAVNNYLQINFCHFCNYFRVREACLVFFNNHDLEFEQWMKLSGFGSKSTFRGCFSYYVGLSPAKWQREVLQRLNKKEDISADHYIKDFRCTLYR